MTSGLAMKMKLELSSLARRHRVEPKLSIALPLHPPSPRSVLITWRWPAPTASIKNGCGLLRAP
jgi:hypothetical protein